MINEMKQEEFLTRNRIDQGTWEAASIDWSVLKEIGLDYERYGSQLREYAGMLAKVMQQYQGVHSIRWRIKDVEHMLEKIVRKRALKVDKYLEIDVKNYYSIITDLVGIRALHLFKSEALDIDASLRENQQLIDGEKPLVYTRKGDVDSGNLFAQELFEHRDHQAGYRSVHYIIQAQPQKRQVYAEVQVRTIFEEGWSEIDHQVRYPNLTSNNMINVFLAIFNRLAGQADEMGSFVQDLAKASTATQAELTAAHEEKRKSLEAIDALVSELEEKTEQHAQSQSAVSKLKDEVSRMKSAAKIAEVRAGVFPDQWMKQVNAISGISGINNKFYNDGLAAQAAAAELGGMFPSSLHLQALESINSLIDMAAGRPGRSKSQTLPAVANKPRRKKEDGGGE